MQCNVGEKEVRFRILIGALLGILAIVKSSIIIALVSAGVLYSGFQRKCYIYKLLKIDTTKDSKNKD